MTFFDGREAVRLELRHVGQPLVVEARGLDGGADIHVERDDVEHHLQHRVGHPMERTVDALVQAGLRIPAVAPDLGPVVPDGHGHGYH